MHPNETPDTALLPRDPATGEALPQTQQPGYYPGIASCRSRSSGMKRRAS